MRHTIAAGIVMLAITSLWLWLSPEPERASSAVGPRPNESAEPRRAVGREPGTRTVIATPSRPAAPGFDGLLRQLVGLVMRGHEEVAREQWDQARATDAEAFALFQHMLVAVGDIEDRALCALTAMGAGDDLPTRLTRQTLGRFLECGLQRRQRLATAGRRAELLTYVDALLGLLASDRANADLVAALLIDQPYLGAEHEDSLLQLSELGVHHPHLHELAPRLLLTLWANLLATGARSRSELESLAMIFREDQNPARRAAALATLLASADPRLVEVVLADVTKSNDEAGAAALAQVAARQLEPARALQVVLRLARVGTRSMTGPALILGSRDAKAVRECYEQLLGEGREPKLRAELITGLGFNPSRDNFDLVQLALELDPDPEVRQRALLALTGAGPRGDQAVQTALADPRFTDHPASVDVLVTAIDNLVRSGEVDAATRWARRIASRKDISESNRVRLRTLLARAQPTERR